MQAVQRKLLTKETQAKADKSPVTVADYGELNMNMNFAI